MSEANGVDGLEFLLHEVVLFFFSDRRVTGGDCGGDGVDTMTSPVVVDDLDFLSITHALVQCRFASLHDLCPEVITEASHEKLMPKELLHVLYALSFHDGEVGGRKGSHGNRPDGANGHGLGLTHLVKNLTDPQVVIPDAFSGVLYQLMEVGTSHFGSV